MRAYAYVHMYEHYPLQKLGGIEQRIFFKLTPKAVSCFEKFEKYDSSL